MNSPAENLVPGETIAGRYTVGRKIGEGGMGAVYLATQQPLGREVVLKVLHKSLAGTEEAVIRFESEAHAVSRLNHPNIVTIYDFGTTDDGTLFIAMEYVSGKTLHAIMKDGPLNAERSQYFVESIARALAEAHAHGVVHRDLKPENIMLCETATEGTTLKVLDFGIAKMQGGNENTGRQLTEQDVVIGTPGYMAPEQIQGQEVDARADLYCLGVIWWELLMGRAPLTGDSPIHVLVKHMSEPIPPPSHVNPALTGWTHQAEGLLMQLLAKDPNSRPIDGGALVKELRGLEVNEWSVQSAGQAGNVIADEAAPKATPDVDAFFSGALAQPDSAGGGFPPEGPSPTGSAGEPFPAAAPQPAEDAQGTGFFGTPQGAPASGDPFAGGGDVGGLPEPASGFSAPGFGPGPATPPGAPASLAHTSAPPENRGQMSPAENDPEFESLGGGSSAYSMMMNDIYGDDDDGAPLPGGSPFAIEPSEEDKPKSNPFVWRVEIDGTLRDNVALVEVRKLIEQGRIKPDDMGAPQGDELAPMQSYAPFRAAFSAKKLDADLAKVAHETSGPQTPAHPRQSPARAVGAKRRSRKTTVVVAGVGALAIAGGYLGFVNPDLGASLWDRARAATGVVAKQVVEQTENQHPTLMEAHVSKWPPAPNDARTAQQLVAEGDALLGDPNVEAREKAGALFQRAVSKSPRSPLAVAAYIENLAFLPARAKELDGLAPLTVLSEVAAQHAEPRIFRAQGALLLVDDRPRSAIAPLKKAVQKAPDDGIARWMLAEAYVSQGNLQQAQQHVGKAREQRPQDTRIDLTVAKMKRLQMDFDGAQMALAKRHQNAPDDREVGLLQVRLEADHQRLVDGGTRARMLLEANPNDDRLRLKLARIMTFELDDRTGALEVLRACGPLNEGQSTKDRADLLAFRSTLAFDAKQSTRAAADLKKAQKFAPRRLLVQYALSLAQLRDGKFQAAAATATEAVGRSKGKLYESDLWVVIADAMVAESSRNKGTKQKPSFLEARRHYRNALTANPQNPHAHAGLLTQKLRAEQLREGSPELIEAVTAFASPKTAVELPALVPDTTGLARLARSIRAHRVTANPLVKKTVAAFVASARGRRGEAQKGLRKVLAKDPDLQAAAVLLGALYLKADKPKSARAKLRKVDPTNRATEVALLLAQSEARLGRVEEASVLLSTSIAASPPPGMLAETEAWLIEQRDGPAAGMNAWRSVLDVAAGSQTARAKLRPPPK